MVSGYTPVFGSIYQGTLCGKWPDAAVWASILPLCDRTGRIDYTPEAIAALTGWPLDLLRQGLEGLCQPDPHSRSDAEDGCRLQLIDPARSWGWVVVNHTKYREKARLMGREAARIATGENRRRMAARRATPDDPREPPPTHPHTHTQTHTQTRDKSAVALPDWLDKTAWREWEAYRTESRKPLRATTIRQQLAFLQQQPNHPACIRQSIRNQWAGLFPLKGRDVPEGPPIGDPAKEKANLDRLATLAVGVKRIPK